MKLLISFTDGEKLLLKANAAAFTIGALMIGLGQTLTKFSNFLDRF